MNTLSLQVDSELVLSAISFNDAPEIFAAVESNRGYLREWLPWLDRTRAVGDTLKFIEQCREEADKKEAVQGRAGILPA